MSHRFFSATYRLVIQPTVLLISTYCLCDADCHIDGKVAISRKARNDAATTSMRCYICTNKISDTPTEEREHVRCFADCSPANTPQACCHDRDELEGNTLPLFFQNSFYDEERRLRRLRSEVLGLVHINRVGAPLCRCGVSVGPNPLCERQGFDTASCLPLRTTNIMASRCRMATKRTLRLAEPPPKEIAMRHLWQQGLCSVLA